MTRYAPFTVDEIRCQDCDTVFAIDSDLVLTSKLEPQHKNAVVLVYVPKQCPECKNLKVVTAEAK